MSDSSAYLETQVMTAPPHKLHSMLVEGALRFTTQAIQHMQAGEKMEGVKATGRAREIVSEVMVSFRTDDQQLSGRVRRIYLFLFRQLTEAQLEQDIDKLHDAHRVLEAEAATWREVCQKNPGQSEGHEAHPSAAPSPHMPLNNAPNATPESPSAGGFSLEA